MAGNVNLNNTAIRCANIPQIVPATEFEINLYDFNHSKNIDTDIENDGLIWHRNYKKESQFAKDYFDFDKSEKVDTNEEKLAYKNHKLSIIANFFKNLGFEQYNSLQKIKKVIAQEHMTSDMLKKTFTNDKFVDDLYFDIKYNGGRTYIDLFK